MWRCDYKRVVSLISLAFAIVFTSSNSVAAAVPAHNAKMNTAIGGVINQKVSKWGFASNDPRVAATFSGVGAGLTTVAVGVATGAVATVGWPALLVGAGITAVVGGGVSLGMDSLYRWIFNADGTITTNSPGTAGTPITALAFVNGAYIQTSSWTDGMYVEVSLGADCLPYRSGYARGTVAGTLPFNYGCSNYDVSPPVPYEMRPMNANVLNGGTAQPTTTVAGPVPSVDAIPDTEAAKPLSDEMLAAAANVAWKSAAMSSGGLPWSASDPITPADVAQWKAANPAAVPTVSDFIAPAVPTSGTSVAVSPTASTSTAVGPASTPGTGTQVDLGPNPNTPSPTLEATPTANQILGPILNLMPDLKNFTVPSHAAECPRPSFTALGSQYTLSSHCGLIESNRAIIEAAMMLVFSIAATMIVLRA